MKGEFYKLSIDFIINLLGGKVLFFCRVVSGVR